MSEKLTREQIEEWRDELADEYQSNRLAVKQLTALCDMALSALPNADQIKFVTHCEKVAEKRGFAEAIEKAVEVLKDAAESFDVVSSSARRNGMFDRANRAGFAAISLRESSAVIRALSPSTDTVRVPEANVLKDITTEWETAKEPGTVAVHSKMIGGVLCRWWGENEPSGVKILARAMIAEVK